MTAQPGKLLPVTLALQGGGTHGAFAWGVLDRLLEDKTILPAAITASSGGAMNAVVLADGYVRGGANGAREHLAAFWKKVSIAASMLPLRHTVMDKMLSNVGIDLSPSSIALDYLTKLFSPYQFNMFDFNPLRSIVEEMVDFEALRAQSKIQLFINATHVRSGEARIFTNRDISLDAVMASACLPFIFRTVMVEDEPYWDGGYSGHPALFPLAAAEVPRDVLLIQSAPILSDEVPTKAADILDRATEIGFNSSLSLELRALTYFNRMQPDKALSVHTIEANDLLSASGRASKLNADWDFLLYLHDLGVQAAADWTS